MHFTLTNITPNCLNKFMKLWHSSVMASLRVMNFFCKYTPHWPNLGPLTKHRAFTVPYFAVLRIWDVYPGNRILIFTHPGSRIQKQQQERGEKKFVVIPFYVTTNFTKLKTILVLKCWRKKFGPIFKELQIFLPKKLSQALKNMGLGSRIRDRDPEKTYSGSRIQGSKRHRIPDLNPQHLLFLAWLKGSF